MTTLPAPLRQSALTCLLLAVLMTIAACGSAPRSSSGSPASIRYTPLSSDQSEDIAIHALGLVGTPYRYGGNSPQGGFDCSGLIGYVYRSRAGLSPPRTVAQLSGFGEAVDRSDLRTGDLVLFGSGQPSHAGIYVGDGRFVHAPSTGGTVRLDKLASAYWSRQPLSVRRP